jgi:polyribonucleotide nucleotidyltransferase
LTDNSFEPVVSSVETVLDNGKYGQRTIKFETGLLARQAAGSVTAYLDDDTMLLSATTAGKTPKEQFDFFPLTIDVEERMYAAGKIPGSFFRSEGRPGEDAILTCRLIDRPLRPTFKSSSRSWRSTLTLPTTCSRSTPRRCPPSSPACRSPARSAASASP